MTVEAKTHDQVEGSDKKSKKIFSNVVNIFILYGVATGSGVITNSDSAILLVVVAGAAFSIAPLIQSVSDLRGEWERGLIKQGTK